MIILLMKSFIYKTIIVLVSIILTSFNAENTIERLARREAIGKLIIVISDD